MSLCWIFHIKLWMECGFRGLPNPIPKVKLIFHCSVNFVILITVRQGTHIKQFWGSCFVFYIVTDMRPIVWWGFWIEYFYLSGRLWIRFVLPLKMKSEHLSPDWNSGQPFFTTAQVSQTWVSNVHMRGNRVKQVQIKESVPDHFSPIFTLVAYLLLSFYESWNSLLV